MENNAPWVKPAIWLVVCWLSAIIGFYFYGSTIWLLVPVAFGCLAAVVTITELLHYVREQAIDRAGRERQILLQTPDGLLAEQLRNLASQSPELAAQMAYRIGRPDLVLFPALYGKQAQVVIAGSDITLRFAIHVLERSSDTSMAPLRDFGDGTYYWDSNKEISDRKQWMQFNWLLSQQNMVTRYIPNERVNHAPLWLPPWTPERIISNWLIGSALEPFKRYIIVDEKEEA